jgi:cobalt-precorrin-5B (C1)-methyltransferase
MILVFGGTTEGKAAAELLDFLREPYFYSTKTCTSVRIGGQIRAGAMDTAQIRTFCQEQGVRLIIDAAHPFASHLHENIHTVATELNLTTIRFERTFPEINPNDSIRLFLSFEELTRALLESRFQSILVLTGLQTIPYFDRLRQQRRCCFRILDNPSGIRKARAFGLADEQIIPARATGNTGQLIELAQKVRAEVILSKESGDSGFFSSKVEASRRLNIPLWVVKRPPLPEFTHMVHDQKELLQTIYQLKKTILKTGEKLRTGLTTGTCVTAAAKACFLALANNRFPRAVEVDLPAGEKASFLIFSENLSETRASCVVIKDAGDDPDVTHAREIGCELSLTDQPGIRFERGAGIGLVTLPGLQVAVGEPAINPVPRKMISEMIRALALEYETETGFVVKPFVPEGEKIARQTFNPRVGVVGGISVIGTSGKVIPFSHEAFLSTIKYQLSVAKETGVEEIVLTSGKRSENILQPDFPHLPETAYIHYGNLVGETIRLAVQYGIKKINLGIMFGKGIKLAEGHLDTHSKKALFNPDFAAQIARECGYPDNVIAGIKNMKLANAIRSVIPFSETDPFCKRVAQRCFETCRGLIPDDSVFRLILLTEQGDQLEFGG